MPIGALWQGLILLELNCLMIFGASIHLWLMATRCRAPIPGDVTNTEALGRILYTDYVYFFQAGGAILLVAMIGAIVLTSSPSNNPKQRHRQPIVAHGR